MANCAIVGINWGDEGKGRMVDYLTSHYDVVVRYQGGGNAGHTVVNDKGTFALHLLPSGIFREGVVNILGNGVALDCENLLNEMNTIRNAGVPITPENLKISDRASLLLPWHRELDGLEEARLADKKYGSTKQGIAPFYSDKYQKKTVMAGELLHPQHLKEHLADLLEWKNLTLQKVYGAKGYTMEELLNWVDTYCEAVKPYITDTTRFLRDAQKAGKSILFEAQLGALRDLDYGIYPYTSSSNAVAACLRPSWTRLWAWSRPTPPAWAKAPLCASGLATRLRSSGMPVGSTAQRPAVPAGSVPSIWWPPATACRFRVRPTLP